MPQLARKPRIVALLLLLGMAAVEAFAPRPGAGAWAAIGSAAEAASAGGASTVAAPKPLGSAVTLDERALAEELVRRVSKVEEFRYLGTACRELRIRCWLFGGTAAGYGHYVKWDLLREGGDSRYQPDRFDYDYTNIYRSTQDADIVIDGNVQQAEALEGLLKEKFPHFQGSKSVWEVRLLGAARGDKEPLLGNPDFLNQHTDSNSTGMIEVTKPPPGEGVVRDLRDWTPAEGRSPQFLRDLRDGKIHYYFSELHGSTSRARKGLNPPILSAIRLLTKAFQYELEIRPEDWALLKRVADDFRPSLSLPEYQRSWLEKNGSKLFQNAVNLEYAATKLDELGLRDKLKALGNVEKQGTLAWWMNRQPLRSSALGVGEGKTAAELGISVVGHETSDFLAYESITRAHTGDPNVLLSRGGFVGEAAILGDGFYAAAGREGARGTGLTIRFTVAPDAREGTDFLLERPRSGAAGPVAEGEFIVFRNKKALRVIPESLNIGPLEYFRLLAGDKLGQGDQGILEKARRRIGHRLAAAPEDLGKVRDFVRSLLAGPDLVPPRVLQEYWRLVPEHPDYALKLGPPEYFKLYFASGPSRADKEMFERLRTAMAGAAPFPEYMKAAMRELPAEARQQVVRSVRQHLAGNPRVHHGAIAEYLAYTRGLAPVSEDLGLVEYLRALGGLEYTPELGAPVYQEARARLREQLAVLSPGERLALAEGARPALNPGEFLRPAREAPGLEFLRLPELYDTPEARSMLERFNVWTAGSSYARTVLNDEVYTHSYWAKSGDGLGFLRTRLEQHPDLIASVARNPDWIANPEFLELLRGILKESWAEIRGTRVEIFSSPALVNDTGVALIDEIIDHDRRRGFPQSVGRALLAPVWREHPEAARFLRLAIDAGFARELVRRHVIDDEEWKRKPAYAALAEAFAAKYPDEAVVPAARGCVAPALADLTSPRR